MRGGSLPGDLHKLWRTRDPKGYHVEYGYSCMGYEIAGGLGVRMACPDRDVYVMVGDGSYLMMAQELVTAVQENVKIIVVLVQNNGFASIGALSEGVGSQRFGTSYRYRDPEQRAAGRRRAARRPGGQRSQPRRTGAARRGRGRAGGALPGASGRNGPVLVQVETDPFVPAPTAGRGGTSRWPRSPPLASTPGRRRAGYESAGRTNGRYLDTAPTDQTRLH